MKTLQDHITQNYYSCTDEILADLGKMYVANERFKNNINILQVWEAIKKYNPETVGYCWDDKNPRIQLEPRGERGYIELVAVKAL